MNKSGEAWEPMSFVYSNEDAFHDSVGSLDIDDLASPEQSDNEESISDYQIDIARAFDNSIAITNTTKTKEYNEAAVERENNLTVKRATKGRSPSPQPKRRQKISAMEAAAISSRLASSVMSRDEECATSVEDLREQYNLSLQHLALSMRRSEMTRQEIARQQQRADTNSKILDAEAQTFSKADRFLSGSRSTLTVGLEQSRSMLKTYMHQMMNPFM